MKKCSALPDKFRVGWCLHFIKQTVSSDPVESKNQMMLELTEGNDHHCKYKNGQGGAPLYYITGNKKSSACYWENYILVIKRSCLNL